MKKKPVCLLLCLWSLAALGVRAAAAEPSPTLPDGAIWALGAWALWALYRRWLECLRTPGRLWALAVLFAGVMTLGQSFAQTGTAEWVTGHPKAALLFFSGRVPLYAACLRLLTDWIADAGKGRTLRTWQWSGLIYLCWLPWYVCLFPGTVSNDSVSQLMMILGLAPLTNANPICQTGLVALFRRLGLALAGSPDLGVALYCVTQSALMAWLLGSLLHEMRGPLAWGSFAFYAFCPIFPVFAFCVGKDTNFAMAVLLLALETCRCTAGKSGVRRMAGLSVAAVACTLLRNPGIYLALLTLAGLLGWAVRQGEKRWRAPLCAIGCTVVVFAALHLLVLPRFEIAPMPETEEYSIPLQQIARVAAGDALTEEQAAALSGVLPVEELKAAYNGELSDPVKDLWKQGASSEDKAAFWRAWLSVVRTEPVTCVSATFHNTYAYLYPGYMSTIKPTLLIGDQSSRTANVHGLYDFSVNPRSAALKNGLERLKGNPLYRILVSPGLYGWLTLLCAAWLCSRRSRRLLLSAVPALFTLAGCLLSAVNGYFRYAMPLYLSAPLLLWLMSRKGKID